MITTAQEFVDLRTSSAPEEYMRAATEEAPIEVWMDVLREFPAMKIWVIRNKTVPIDILNILASDPDPRIRSEVATKNKLSPELMELLASDEDASVRLRIAYNKNAGPVVLERLARDESELISSQARNRLTAK
jgi:hypothetical protein